MPKLSPEEAEAKFDRAYTALKLHVLRARLRQRNATGQVTGHIPGTVSAAFCNASGDKLATFHPGQYGKQPPMTVAAADVEVVAEQKAPAR